MSGSRCVFAPLACEISLFYRWDCQSESSDRQNVSRSNGTYLIPWSLRGAAGDVAIQWACLSVRGSKMALRAGFMTGLPRSARNDERGESVQLRLSKCHSCLDP